MLTSTDVCSSTNEMEDISNHFHLLVFVLLSTEEGLLGSESYTVWTTAGVYYLGV